VNAAEGIAGLLGSLGTLGALIWVVMRATAGRVRAIDDNTDAVRDLTAKIDQLGSTVNGHETRISRLEGWRQTKAPW
jgi:hypothetical protein